jgi:TOMM system kinase/cyclase fusion protein
MAQKRDEFEFDVFISYSHRNEDWVCEWLLPRLRKRRLRVCLDREAFEPGEPSVLAMERAVLTSRKTLLVLTPEYVASEWTEFENLLVQTQDPSARQRRLIPLLVNPCDVPLRLGMLTHVDFTDAEQQEFQLDRLVAAIRGKRASKSPRSKTKPKSPPPPPQEDTTTQVAPPKSPEAERRHLTVMGCELLVSSTSAEPLDPEELHAVAPDFQRVCAEVIRRFEGHVAQDLGDRLVVYFGHPLSHEDDTQRAVRAGLGIVEGMKRLQTDAGRRLSARVGIHSGLVVIGEQGEQTALGETPKIADWLRENAEPHAVVMSDATHRLVRSFFDCAHLGAGAFRGTASTPIQFYQVLSERSGQNLEGTASMPPLVGREQEVELLLQRWEQVKEGMGQVVLLNGEAGIGKTRLVQTLKERVRGEPHTCLECRCSPYYQNSALYPVIDLLHRALELRREDSPDEKMNKLEASLTRNGVPLSEVAPLFASLLSLPMGERYPPLTLSPERQKQKTVEALLAVLLKMSAQRPVLLIVEDLHWIDPSTLDLLDLIVDQGPTARIFTLLTFRPDFHPSWSTRSHVTPLMLHRLSSKQAETLVETVTGGKTLPPEVLQQVVAKTDGIPLFVEELTKMVLESDWLCERNGRYELTAPLPPLAIPATLHDSLEARLNRLTTGKEIAQIGATIGREFAYELLQGVCSLDEKTLQDELNKLVEAELLYRRGLPPNATFIFKHALIQDAAYQSLLKSKRRQYHQRIAQVLEKRFADVIETQPELIAHHYTEANLPEKAIIYWQWAGERSIQHSANVEAIRHLTKGLELLNALPETPEHIRQELALQMSLGGALTSTKGFAAPEVQQAFARARARCRLLGQPPQLFPVLRGLYAYYLVRGDLETAHELGQDCLRLAQSVKDPALFLESHFALGQVFLCRGDLVRAREHLAQGITLYDPQQHHAHAFTYMQDPGVTCRCLDALALWLSGYPEQALHRSREAIHLAQELGHPFSLAWAMIFAAVVHQLRREASECRERAEAAMSLSTERTFARWLAWGTLWRGWALTEQGQREDGMAQIQQGLTADRAMGAESVAPYILGLLSEAHGKMGQVEQGLNVLSEAVAIMDKNGERAYEAELYRLKGELIQKAEGRRQKADVEAEAEACFHQALEVARRQNAKSWQLRTAMSLSRLWLRQGKKDEARQLLSEVYGWFTEGFDTADLKEARELLEAVTSDQWAVSSDQ